MTTLYKKEDQSSPEQPELTLIGAASIGLCFLTEREPFFFTDHIRCEECYYNLRCTITSAKNGMVGLFSKFLPKCFPTVTNVFQDL
jgi:hypothetical protein